MRQTFWETTLKMEMGNALAIRASFIRNIPRNTPPPSSPGVGMFHSDFLPILHENSKRVTVASKLVSGNDSGDIRTLLLTDLSAYKVISDFYRSKLSGWASARTSILRLGPGLLRTREDRIPVAQLAASPILAGQPESQLRSWPLTPFWPASRNPSCAAGRFPHFGRPAGIPVAQLAASPIRAFSAVLGSECFTLISCRFSTKTQNG